MCDHQITGILIEKGKALFDAPREFISFTGNKHADILVNDLENTPHAFVLACIMDRQIKAELAWMIPYRISEKLGTFEFQALEQLDINDVEKLMTEPEPLHRFPKEMSNNFYQGIQTIAQKYKGNAATIWVDKPSSADVVYRFLEFRGVGQKIATMATNSLVREFKIDFSDYYSVDVSIDVHVKRVFRRLGLIPMNATREQIIFRARALSPEFPGLLEMPIWEIGRNWCRKSKPLCLECYMQQVCPKIVE